MRLFASRSLRKSIYPRRSMLFRHISEKCAKRRVIQDGGTGFSAIALSRVNFSIAKKKYDFGISNFSLCFWLGFSGDNIGDGNRTFVRKVFLPLAYLIKRGISSFIMPAECTYVHYISQLSRPQNSIELPHQSAAKSKYFADR